MFQILQSIFFILLALYIFMPLSLYGVRPDCLASFCNKMLWRKDYRIKFCRWVIFSVCLMYLPFYALYIEVAGWDDGLILYILAINFIRPLKIDTILLAIRGTKQVFFSFVIISIGLYFGKSYVYPYAILLTAMINASLFYPSGFVRKERAKFNNGGECDRRILSDDDPEYLVNKYLGLIGWEDS